MMKKKLFFNLRMLKDKLQFTKNISEVSQENRPVCQSYSLEDIWDFENKDKNIDFGFLMGNNTSIHFPTLNKFFSKNNFCKICKM